MDTPTAVASIDEGAIDDRRMSARDRRISPRTKTLKGGIIIWDSNGSAVKCTVHNLSKMGAKLEAHGLVVKNSFELVFDLDKSRRSCRVVWRKEPMIGARFI
jgi:hypothetical protein